MVASLLFAALAVAPEISVRTMLPEMTDLARLAQRPSPQYTAAQASSYDRKSTAPGVESWFANADYGQYVRTQQAGTREEFVLADLKGPGAVTRIWSANPTGVLRFYFDEETSPRFAPKMVDLLNGKVEGIPAALSYFASRGGNLYFPLPYAKRLVVTVDDSDGAASRLYYHVGYRTFTDAVDVRTFKPSDIADNKALIEEAAARLTNPAKLVPANAVPSQTEWTLEPGGIEVLDLPDGPGAVVEFSIRVTPASATGWTDPNQPHNLLRNLLFTIQADDESCVATPLGDFFGAAPGVNAYQTVPMEVGADGTMTSRWVMPYQRDAVVIIANIGKVPATVAVRLKTVARPFPENGYYFRAGWNGERGSTRPHHDMTFLDATGEGAWVGSMLHVANPVPGWWGEGDEKVFVDGESFPSTFGTGTEDYYGYAWSSNQPFVKPYHSQPRSDGPANRGHSVVNRWHVFDPIPFRKSLKFDMENWHWTETDADFSYTAYWYSAAGGSPPGSIRHELLAVREIEMPKPVEGAIEGEKLTIVSVGGGETEVQGGFWQTSGDQQLWWKGASVGDRLVLRVPVPSAGRYEVIGHFCMATDYGIHQITINGKDAGAPIDFYSTGLKWEKRSLGVFDLPAGDATFQVECKGANAQALPQRMFGLDYVLLKRG